MSYQEAWRETLLVLLHEQSPSDETDFVEAGLVQAVLGLDDTALSKRRLN